MTNKVELKDILPVVESYNEYISRVPLGVQVIADKLREDNVNESLTGIKDFTEGIEWLLHASELLAKNGVAADLKIDKIMGYLEEINSGLEKQDYVLVGDIFEYEIKPFFEEQPKIEGPQQ